MTHIGIDYGSKMAGTTVVCWLGPEGLQWQQSTKKQDADQFILQLATQLQPKRVFIDAPLSLPEAYHKQGDDFFYRQCDRQLKAMSPMFLGGLTARAMKLRHQLKASDILCHETYPGGLVRQLPSLQEHYLKKQKMNPAFLQSLRILLPSPMAVLPTNWHQADALLAWFSGYRYGQKEAQTIGKASEGLIIL
ncbi:MAG: DUF429 domain-containing protein [Bacteroidota bacterium]